MASSPTLTLEAKNPDALATFYVALGFTEVTREQGHAELDLGAVRLSILSEPATVHPPGDSPVGGIQLTLQVDDLASIREALLSAGGVLPTDYRSAWSGTVILDPEGNAVRLLAPTPSTPTAAPRSTGETAAPTAPTAPPGGTPQSATAIPTAPDATSAPPAAPDPNASPAAAPYDDANLPQSSLPATYYSEDGVPTFDAVAERIQQKSATAEGNQVLDAESQRGREEAETMDGLKKAGKDRLDRLRKSMGL